MLILKMTLFLFDILQDDARRNSLQVNKVFFLKFGVFWCGSGGAMLGYLLCALMRNDILNSYSKKGTT